ncbi:MAG: hypothetical protein BGO98_37125 [Myxococcales bacterium 68-20]|nr:MAG: hypothetical protein BGO98_37125 [Myxococcales bacterium 68-20]
MQNGPFPETCAPLPSLQRIRVPRLGDDGKDRGVHSGAEAAQEERPRATGRVSSEAPSLLARALSQGDHRSGRALANDALSCSDRASALDVRLGNTT